MQITQTAAHTMSSDSLCFILCIVYFTKAMCVIYFLGQISELLTMPVLT